MWLVTGAGDVVEVKDDQMPEEEEVITTGIKCN